MSTSTPSEKIPIHLLSVTVAEMGGSQQVTDQDKWPEVAKKLGLLKDAASDVKRVYEEHMKKSMNKPDHDSEGSGEEEYEVERIVDDKKKGKHTYFLVKWRGFSESENSWEPESNLSNCQNIIKAYREAKAKRKTGAPSPEPEGSVAKKLKADAASSSNTTQSTAALMDPNATFETDVADMVVGACQTSQGINLIIRWKGQPERYTWMSSSECRKHIPHLMLDFYESRIKFVGS